MSLAEAVIRLPDPLAATPELTRFLAAAGADKRIVFVGEADHFIHEKADYRLAIVDALSARPLWLGEELSWADGRRIERYLRGDDRALDTVTLYGYTGDQRLDRDDGPTGILKPSFDKFPDPAFVAEHKRWLHALRERLDWAGCRFFGLDVDLTPGAGYRDLALERSSGQTIEQEIAYLGTLLEARADEMDEIDRTTLETLRDGFRYVALAHPAPSYEALAPAMALREQVMHRHADAVLSWCPDDATLVLFAHDLHLARDDGAIHSPGGVGPGGDEVPSLGHHVNEMHRDDVFVVWMVVGGGEDSQPLEGLPRILEPPRGSLNHLLGNVGGNFIVPTREVAELNRTQRLYHLYNSYAEVVPAEQADALVFIERVSPLQNV